ncbi:SDR family oxidoreductase [Shewanella sp. N2AIL]|uniref:UDP-glucose 4-epimerase family protein n=1 Tax=Shewanella sp. N2AIL TaxID=2926851 RepID=UPI001F5739F8|nr:SDR family oxidoreductase [Shewanella sp. N2AIL]MCI2962140.1 SDR family oxidoreductase [Shewanella sp. N2AIL]
MKLLLTGTTGFIGRHLLQVIDNIGTETVVLGRNRPENYDGEFILYDLNDSADADLRLQGVDVVIHIAARAHIMNDAALDPLAEYRALNTEATLKLAKNAFESGVKRFIFVSSIKVNGDSTSDGHIFKYSDTHHFNDYYGQSKSEAEILLKNFADMTGLQIVIIRPTLVYGPGVKANFAALMNLVSKGVPLPFGCITQNRRSLVSVTNIVDLIITCIDHPKAANQVFLVSDDHDVSTSEMVRQMAKALGKPSMQVPIPIWCYKFAAKIFNKSDMVDRLIGSLQVDISHTKETLGWRPPQTLKEGFKQAAQAFLQTKTK